MESQKISYIYNITLESKKDFWRTKVLNKWINYKTRCPNSVLETLKLKKIKSIVNPYKLQCNKAKCLKIINLRNNTIFQFFSHTPISVLINAIELFITEEKMPKK